MGDHLQLARDSVGSLVNGVFRTGRLLVDAAAGTDRGVLLDRLNLAAADLADAGRTAGLLAELIRKAGPADEIDRLAQEAAAASVLPPRVLPGGGYAGDGKGLGF